MNETPSSATSQDNNALLLRLNDHVQGMGETLNKSIESQKKENEILHGRINETVNLINSSISQLEKALMTSKQLNWPVVFGFITCLALAASWIRSDTDGRLANLRPVIESHARQLYDLQSIQEKRLEQYIELRVGSESNNIALRTQADAMGEKIRQIDERMWDARGKGNFGF